MTKQINASEFEQEVGKDLLTVIKYGAPWCAACKAIEPVISKFAGTFDDVSFVDMNADANVDFVMNLGIKSLPSFGFYKGGKQLALEKGLNEPALKKKIEELLRA